MHPSEEVEWRVELETAVYEQSVINARGGFTLVRVADLEATFDFENIYLILHLLWKTKNSLRVPIIYLILCIIRAEIVHILHFYRCKRQTTDKSHYLYKRKQFFN